MEVCEVLVGRDHISFCHLVEHRVAKHGHDEEDEHKEDEDIDERVD